LKIEKMAGHFKRCAKPVSKYKKVVKKWRTIHPEMGIVIQCVMDVLLHSTLFSPIMVCLFAFAYASLYI
jgi:hypothetical protein